MQPNVCQCVIALVPLAADIQCGFVAGDDWPDRSRGRRINDLGGFARGARIPWLRGERTDARARCTKSLLRYSRRRADIAFLAVLQLYVGPREPERALPVDCGGQASRTEVAVCSFQFSID